MDALEELVREKQPAAVYVNPVHQNPTGSCLSVANRERLLRLSARHGFLVLSDEPYVMLTFSDDIAEPETSLGTTAARILGPDFKNLICFGSFSKILAPGLRCGWVSGHPDILTRIASHGALVSGGGPPSLVSETVRTLVVSGELEAHIRSVRLKLEARRDALCDALATEFEGLGSFTCPTGGYFLFLKLNDCPDTIVFEQYLGDINANVSILPGARCSVTPTNSKNSSMRLAFSFYSPDEIRDGVKILSSAYRNFIQNRRE
jgi:2-aminoadipate transaminase